MLTHGRSLCGIPRLQLPIPLRAQLLPQRGFPLLLLLELPVHPQEKTRGKIFSGGGVGWGGAGWGGVGWILGWGGGGVGWGGGGVRWGGVGWHGFWGAAYPN